jgi:hypothetical protein
MTLVAAALPPVEVRRDHDGQVLVEAENLIVDILFDDIMRTLLRQATRGLAAPAPVSVKGSRTAPPPVVESRDRRRPAWARSPPGMAGG